MSESKGFHLGYHKAQDMLMMKKGSLWRKVTVKCMHKWTVSIERILRPEWLRQALSVTRQPLSPSYLPISGWVGLSMAHSLSVG